MGADKHRERDDHCFTFLFGDCDNSISDAVRRSGTISNMFGDAPVSFSEFVMNEPLPLAVVQSAVLEFLRGKDDAVLFGAQAVNAYVSEPRATQDVDIASPRARELADEIKTYLNDRFHIAVRVRQVREGLGYRIYQLQKTTNRHLVDVRPTPTMPPSTRLEGILVVTPPELIAQKVLAWQRRAGKPKAFTDRRDLAVLLLAFPELKQEQGPVRERLLAAGANEPILNAWRELVATDIQPEEDDDEFT